MVFLLLFTEVDKMHYFPAADTKICENTDSRSGVIISGKNRGWYLRIFLVAFCKLCGQLLFHYLFSTYESPVVFIEADKDFSKAKLEAEWTLTKVNADFSDKVPFEFFSQVSGFCRIQGPCKEQNSG